MDLNLSRRKRELGIAAEVAAEFINETTPESAAPDRLVHLFATVCQRFEFTPTEDSVARIMRYTLKAIAKKNRALQALARSVDGVSTLIERRAA
jgi:hypothetical protein